MIYCINPYCEARENNDDTEFCVSCGTPLLILSRLKLVHRFSADSELDVYDVIDTRNTFSGNSGTHKILKVLKSVDPDRQKAFQTEALILQSLRHSAIPKVDALHDSFEVDVSAINRCFPCLIMSKFEGVTLEEHVLRTGAIGQQVAIDYLQQLGAILQYIHTVRINDEWGVIHRDIKPGNIIVQPDGKLALIDFGFGLIMTNTYQSRLGTGRAESSRVETIYYTPPEQLAGRTIPQSDFFSLGMTIIFALTGRQLYEMEIQSWRPQWKKYVKYLDYPLIQFLERLTNSDAHKRPASAEELLSVVSDTLPAKLKWRARLRTTPYRIAIGSIAVLTAVGLFQLGRYAVAQYYFSQGDNATKLSNFSEARKQYEQSIKILANADSYNNLGIVCSALGETSCAFESYKKTIELNPKGWEGYYQLASYYEDLAEPDYSLAEKYYRKAVALSQSNVLEPRNNLARILILRKKYLEAKPILERSLAISKETRFLALILKNLGWLYFEQKNYAEAEKYLLQAANLNDTLNSPHCLLAKIYALKKKEPLQELESCLTLTGEDLVNPEVIRWRNENIKMLLHNKSRSNTSIFPS